MKKQNFTQRSFPTIETKHCVLLGIQFLIMLTVVFLSACASPLEPVDSAEEEKVKSELHDRSFRQFDPEKDASKRKAVIIDFFDDTEGNIIRLWAQYAEGDYALKEWEIFAKDYSVKKGGSEYRLYFEKPNSYQNLPSKCNDCIETKGISISIRNLYNEEKIQFKINDENKSLPAPFPVFKSWTKFNEDEYFD